jgi:hypothetical protein
MPLLYKPRDPSYGLKIDRRKPNKRKRISALVLPETKEYLISMKDRMPAGRLIDDAIKLYRKSKEHERSAKLID